MALVGLAILNHLCHVLLFFVLNTVCNEYSADMTLCIIVLLFVIHSYCIYNGMPVCVELDFV